ncbi:crotonase/enoyl-CoA hydratase family protein [Ferrimonas sediminicola]|uniref:Crotonase/enoyl-CoA hydratase family protein n=1 Tax=Ferrimonas sediminicola TaxID=2569538 RepID=A0A4U1BJ76_9GAMM|nr:crotonase/enoyl-CoA hydratase family protein [Ferrimonas sediminicola]TKB51423.1 crotonase/enoyl-CoA hydratase family protein [Ferrimonas sediminicola]
MSEKVILSVDDGIALVELNRPEKCNALDYELFKALVDVQKRIADMREVRAVVLTGRGKDFCSGIDIKSMFRSPSIAMRLLFKVLPWSANRAQRVSTGWRDLPVPVIAAIQGRCWGGGMQIALGADFRIANRDASLAVMEGRWGLIPDMGGTLALREQLPQDQALLLSMMAEPVTAEEARSLNLVTELAEDARERSLQLARALCERSPNALAEVKRLYKRRGFGSNGAVLFGETWGQIRAMLSKNQRIAVARQQGKERNYLPR